MKKYLALYMAPLASFNTALKAGPEEMKKGMDEWMKWSKAHASNIVELGAPVGKTKKVTAAGTSDIRNMIGGYSIVQAESLDAAAKLFENHPHFGLQDGSVEVMEFVQMPGM